MNLYTYEKLHNITKTIRKFLLIKFNYYTYYFTKYASISYNYKYVSILIIKWGVFINEHIVSEVQPP